MWSLLTRSPARGCCCRRPSWLPRRVICSEQPTKTRNFCLPTYAERATVRISYAAHWRRGSRRVSRCAIEADRASPDRGKQGDTAQVDEGSRILRSRRGRKRRLLHPRRRRDCLGELMQKDSVRESRSKNLPYCLIRPVSCFTYGLQPRRTRSTISMRQGASPGLGQADRCSTATSAAFSGRRMLPEKDRTGWSETVRPRALRVSISTSSAPTPGRPRVALSAIQTLQDRLVKKLHA